MRAPLLHPLRNGTRALVLAGGVAALAAGLWTITRAPSVPELEAEPPATLRTRRSADLAPGASRAGVPATSVPCPYCGPGTPPYYQSPDEDALDGLVNLASGAVQIDIGFFKYSNVRLYDPVTLEPIPPRAGAGSFFWNTAAGFVWLVSDDRLLVVGGGGGPTADCMRVGGVFTSRDVSKGVQVALTQRPDGKKVARVVQQDGTAVEFWQTDWEPRRLQQTIDFTRDGSPVRSFEYLPTGQLSRVYRFTHAAPPTRVPAPELEFRYAAQCVLEQVPASPTTCVPGGNGHLEPLIDSVVLDGTAEPVQFRFSAENDGAQPYDRPFTWDEFNIRRVIYPRFEGQPHEVLVSYYKTSAGAPWVPKRSLVRQVQLKPGGEVWSFSYDFDQNFVTEVSLPTRFSYRLAYFVDTEHRSNLAGHPDLVSVPIRVRIAYLQGSEAYRTQVVGFESVRLAGDTSRVYQGGLDARVAWFSGLLDPRLTAANSLPELLALPPGEQDRYTRVAYKQPVLAPPGAPPADAAFGSHLPVEVVTADRERYAYDGALPPHEVLAADDGPADDPLPGDTTSTFTYARNAATGMDQVVASDDAFAGLHYKSSLSFGDDAFVPTQVAVDALETTFTETHREVQHSVVCAPITVPVVKEVPPVPNANEDAGAPDAAGAADGGADAGASDGGARDGGAGDADADAAEGGARDGGGEGGRGDGGGSGSAGGGTLVSSLTTTACAAVTNVRTVTSTGSAVQRRSDGYLHPTYLAGENGEATLAFDPASKDPDLPTVETITLATGQTQTFRRTLDPATGSLASFTDPFGNALAVAIDGNGVNTGMTSAGPKGEDGTLVFSSVVDERTGARTETVIDRTGASAAYHRAEKTIRDRCDRPVARSEAPAADLTAFEKRWDADYPYCAYPRAVCENIPTIGVRVSPYDKSFFCEEECQWVQYCYCAVLAPYFPFDCQAWTYTLISATAPAGPRFCETEAQAKGLLQACLR